MQADPFMHKYRKHCHNGHKSKTADLNQRKNNQLSKKAPMHIGIHDNESCYTGSACRRKKRVQKRRPFMDG